MRRGTWIPIVGIVLVAAVAAGFAVASRQELAAWMQAGSELLSNPGFEGGFYRFNDIGELEVGNGWQVWYDGSQHRPEYKAETRSIGRGRVRSGEHAQKFFTTFASHDGGIYQEVYDLEPGAWYRFSVWAYQWSSGQDNPDQSTGDGKCSALVGINPWGDAQVRARTTVWGKEALQVYNEWTQVEVIAQAWSDKMVVALRQDCEWPVKHNDAYLDDARLELVSAPGGPTPTPEPTRACPTAEPGAGIDYERIRSLVETVVVERDPVRWPR